MQRTESLTSEAEDKTKEVENIKKVLKTNGYKHWIFNTMQPRRNKANINTRETNIRQHAIVLPYISKLSEQLARIFKSYDLPVYHKPINTPRCLLVHPKDKTGKAAKFGVVYHINCQYYKGETARPLST